MQPHIDFLWYKKYPQLLEKKDRLFLERFSPFYLGLNDDQKELFEKRISVFTRSKSFKLVTSETVNMPEDFKIAIAGPAIQLTLRHNEFLYKNFDYFFAYNHPFPSPEIKVLHSVEINYEDRMTVFDIEMLINSFNPANKLFNTGIYAFSGIFQHLNPKIVFDTLDNDLFWEKVKIISGFNKDFISLATGIEPESQFQILSVMFFTHNNATKSFLPVQYDQLRIIYNFA